MRLFGETLIAARQGQVQEAEQVLSVVQAPVGLSEVFLAASPVGSQQVESQALPRVGSLFRHQSLSDFVFQLATLWRGMFQVLWAPFLERALARALVEVLGQVLVSPLVQASGL